jgi:ribonuclease HI
MDTNVLQINLGRCKQATQLLFSGDSSVSEFLIVQEPYLIHNNFIPTPLKITVFGDFSSRCRAAILHNKKQYTGHFISDLSTPDCSIVLFSEIANRTNQIIIVSAYVPPRTSSNQLIDLIEETTHRFPETSILLGGDFNAHNPSWGGEYLDHYGATLQDALIALDFNICNNSSSAPTFTSASGHSSWIDVTFYRKKNKLNIRDWEVQDQVTVSDHFYLSFNLDSSISTILQEVRYNFKKADWKIFCNELRSSCADIPSQLELAATTDEVDNVVEIITSNIIQALNKAVPILHLKFQNSSYWWNKDLSTQRRKVRALFRLSRKSFDPTVKDIRWQHYKTELRIFKKMIKEAKDTSWKRFCSSVDPRNPFGLLYKIISKHSKHSTPHVLPASTNTSIRLDYIRETISLHIPGASDKSPEPLVHDESLLTNISTDPFTMDEVTTVLQNMKPNKAHGPDNIPSPCLHWIGLAIKTVLHSLFNICLKFGYFPKKWKEAKLILIPKSHENSSFRPISLLPVIGKVFDKLITNRLTFFLHSKSLLSSNQFGFTRQKSTSGALQLITDTVRYFKCNKFFSAIISLDVKKAFDSAQWNKILQQLIQFGIPRNLFLLIRSFLDNRKITFEQKTLFTTQGCPQGSCIGPVLWNVISNPLLQNIKQPHTVIVGFADDYSIIVGAESVEDLQERASSVLASCINWADEIHISFNILKTQALFFTPSAKLRQTPPPSVSFQGEDIPWKNSIKILGLNIDNRLNFTTHIKILVARIRKFNSWILRAVGSTWGLSPEILRRIYISVIKPIASYAADVWGFRASIKTVASLLDSAMRPFLLRLCKAFRTTPTSSLWILSRISPISMDILHQYNYRRAIREQSLSEKQVLWASGTPPWRASPIRPSPMNESPMQADLTIFTDGSKTDVGVGAAFIVWKDPDCSLPPEYSASYSLSKKCTVFQAEVFALLKCSEWLLNYPSAVNTINIFTDSTAALSAIANFSNFTELVFTCRENFININTKCHVNLIWIKGHSGISGNEAADHLAKEACRISPTSFQHIPRCYFKRLYIGQLLQMWQKSWDECSTGRTTYEYLPVIPEHFTPFPRYATYFITGHGPFQSYLNRFNLKTDPNCQCGFPETPDHILFCCKLPNREQARGFLMQAVVTSGCKWPCEKKTFLDPLIFKAFSKFCQTVIKL